MWEVKFQQSLSKKELVGLLQVHLDLNKSCK
jgi:hypothetical protein